MISSKFQQRLISAIVLIPIVVAVFWMSGIVLAAFMLLLFCLAYTEWVRITKWNDKRQWFLTIIGFFYCAVGFVSLYELSNQVPHIWIPVCVFVSVWMSDSCAYFVGKSFGGPKMAPSISPNKTWSGLAGACLGPAIAVFAFQIIYDMKHDIDHDVSEFKYMLLAIEYGVVVGIAGQLGDLMISYLKRKSGLKDTGNLIPGHGGILDRIDALLLVCILFWVWMQMGGYSFLFHVEGGWNYLWNKLI
jgi:phosphatidate cytidylyltransferase